MRLLALWTLALASSGGRAERCQSDNSVLGGKLTASQICRQSDAEPQASSRSIPSVGHERLGIACAVTCMLCSVLFMTSASKYTSTAGADAACDRPDVLVSPFMSVPLSRGDAAALRHRCLTRSISRTCSRGRASVWCTLSTAFGPTLWQRWRARASQASSTHHRLAAIGRDRPGACPVDCGPYCAHPDRWLSDELNWQQQATTADRTAIDTVCSCRVLHQHLQSDLLVARVCRDLSSTRAPNPHRLRLQSVRYVQHAYSGHLTRGTRLSADDSPRCGAGFDRDAIH